MTQLNEVAPQDVGAEFMQAAAEILCAAMEAAFFAAEADRYTAIVTQWVRMQTGPEPESHCCFDAGKRHQDSWL